MKLYNISLNNIQRRKGKMVFLVLGLLIGIATVVTLLSITESMSRDIEDRLDQFGANIVMTPKSDNLSLSYGGISVGGVNYEAKEFEEESIAAIREIENAKNLGVIAPKVLGGSKIGDKTVLLMGVDFEAEFALKTWWMMDGDMPAKADDLLIGSEVAKILDLKQGDSVELGGHAFTVTALLEPTGGNEDNIVIGDMHAIQKVLGKEGRVSLVEISAFCRGCPISDMVLQIAEKFPDAKVTALKQAVMSKMQSIEIFKSFSYGIAVLVILIGALLVFVTMMGSVNERTREIGIFRAIGFRRGHVMQIILLEAMVIGLIGGALGYFSGNGIAYLVMPLVLAEGKFAGFNLTLGGLSLIMAVSLSLLASLYPAQKASNLDPSEALRAL